MNYYIVVEGKVIGPLSIDKLQNYKILPDTFVKKLGMDDFKEAHEMEEFRALFGFQERLVSPQYFAAFDQRLLASAIDFFCITLIYVFILLLSYAFVNDEQQRITLLILCVPFIILTKYVYGVFADCSKAQGGIGKRVLQIRVTQMDGRKINLLQSFIRNTSKLISVLTLFIGYLYSFLNKKNQCLHDVIADTLVIKDRLI